jgi:hypothetical protein
MYLNEIVSLLLFLSESDDEIFRMKFKYFIVQWRPLIWKHQDFSVVNCLSL